MMHAFSYAIAPYDNLLPCKSTLCIKNYHFALQNAIKSEEKDVSAIFYRFLCNVLKELLYICNQ